MLTEYQQYKIVQYEGQKSLKKLASMYNTTWQEIYYTYSDIVDNKPLYQKYKIRAKVHTRCQTMLHKARQIKYRRLNHESKRNTDAIYMEATKSRPYIRGVRVIQNKSRENDINNK